MRVLFGFTIVSTGRAKDRLILVCVVKLNACTRVTRVTLQVWNEKKKPKDMRKSNADYSSNYRYLAVHCILSLTTRRVSGQFSKWTMQTYWYIEELPYS